MKHRTLALLLAVALTLCLPCTTALAAEEPLPPDNSAAQTGDGPTPEAYIPDPEGTVTFQNLDRRMREIVARLYSRGEWHGTCYFVTTREKIRL